MRPRNLFAVLLLASSFAASSSVPAASTPPDLAWLGGHWCGGEGGERIEEVWLAPVAGSTIGLSRTEKAGRVGVFEFMRIDQVDGVATFLAQPRGREATAFPATEAGPGWIRFANEHHDFPQRIDYRREGEELHAQIAGPGEDGKELVIPFRYRRCPG